MAYQSPKGSLYLFTQIPKGLLYVAWEKPIGVEPFTLIDEDMHQVIDYLSFRSSMREASDVYKRVTPNRTDLLYSHKNQNPTIQIPISNKTEV